jgi:hypothetical protein
VDGQPPAQATRDRLGPVLVDVGTGSIVAQKHVADEEPTTKWAFPGPSSTELDPAIGSNGRVARETHIYALPSHMHRHGVRSSAFLTNQGRDLDPPWMIDRRRRSRSALVTASEAAYSLPRAPTPPPSRGGAPMA